MPGTKRDAKRDIKKERRRKQESFSSDKGTDSSLHRLMALIRNSTISCFVGRQSCCPGRGDDGREAGWEDG